VGKKSSKISKLFSDLFQSDRKKHLHLSLRDIQDLVLDIEWAEIKKVIVQKNLHQDSDLVKLKEVYKN
jgi:hypothetical protein